MEVYSVVVLGSGGVGKSSLILQFVKQIFCDDYDPTVEDAYCKRMELDGEQITVEILDTAGQESFLAMRGEYILKGEGFLLVYSLRDKQSYMEIPTLHRQISQVKNADNSPCVIVEAMCDLAQSELQEVTEGQGESLAAQLQTLFIRTSAKFRTNVDECFHMLLQLMAESRKREKSKLHKRGYHCCVIL